MCLLPQIIPDPPHLQNIQSFIFSLPRFLEIKKYILKNRIKNIKSTRNIQKKQNHEKTKFKKKHNIQEKDQ